MNRCRNASYVHLFLLSLLFYGAFTWLTEFNLFSRYTTLTMEQGKINYAVQSLQANGHVVRPSSSFLECDHLYVIVKDDFNRLGMISNVLDSVMVKYSILNLFQTTDTHRMQQLSTNTPHSQDQTAAALKKTLLTIFKTALQANFTNIFILEDHDFLDYRRIAGTLTMRFNLPPQWDFLTIGEKPFKKLEQEPLDDKSKYSNDFHPMDGSDNFSLIYSKAYAISSSFMKFVVEDTTTTGLPLYDIVQESIQKELILAFRIFSNLPDFENIQETTSKRHADYEPQRSHAAPLEPIGIQSSSTSRKNINNSLNVAPSNSTSPSRKYNGVSIAIVTYLANQEPIARKHDNETILPDKKKSNYHFKYKTYEEFLPYTMTNMMSYSQTHGHGFFPLNSETVLNSQLDDRKAFWGKPPVVRKYLDLGYEWVLWTDVDVLFINMSMSLEHWTSQTDDIHSIMLVNECRVRASAPRKDHGTIRSGFFFIRNTDIGRSFLDAWMAMYDGYKDKWNPDQDALEALVASKKFEKYIKYFDAEDLHSYPDCIEKFQTKETFSVHFPGHLKSSIGIWYKKITDSNMMSKNKLEQRMVMYYAET